MKNRKMLTVLVITLISLNSCKEKCKVCELTKDGVTTEAKNCAYGGGSSNDSLETWERYLKEEGGYDTVVCHFE